MPAYLIVDTKITDADAYEGYKSQAKPIAEKYGGEYIVRGGAMEVLEVDLWTPTRLVIVKFPDRAAAKAFIASPEYAPLRALRRANAECTLAIVDGF